MLSRYFIKKAIPRVRSLRLLMLVGLLVGQTAAFSETCPTGGTAFLTSEPTQGGSGASDADCTACSTGAQALAVPFTVGGAGGTVEEIVLFGGYSPDSIPPVAPTFRILIHDGGTVPGTTVTDDPGIIPSSHLLTTEVINGLLEYEVVLDVTTLVQLGAGDYWLEVFADAAPDSDYWRWEVGNGPKISAIADEAPGMTWRVGDGHGPAFTICGTPSVPVELVQFDVE